jgi:hypothetical protein
VAPEGPSRAPSEAAVPEDPRRGSEPLEEVPSEDALPEAPLREAELALKEPPEEGVRPELEQTLDS